jgi:membrane-associated phospholipid phosphatase
MIMQILTGLLFGFILGTSLPNLIQPLRQRISILFCLGAVIFSSIINQQQGPSNPLLVGLALSGVFLVTAVIARNFFNPSTRPYAILVGISVFVGFLVGTGASFQALVATAIYLSRFAIPKNFIKLNSSASQIDFRERRYAKMIYVACTVLFICAFSIALFQLDRAFSERFRLWTAPIFPMMRIATHLSDAVVLFPLCAILVAVFWIKRRRTAFVPLLAIASWCVAEAATYILKHVVGRPRPYLWHKSAVSALQLAHFHWFSWDQSRDFIGFPSGHATACFAVAWVLCWLPDSKPYIRFGIFLLALILGAGRITLDQHFAADVLASAAIGIISAQVLIDRFRTQLERCGAHFLDRYYGKSLY